MVGEEKLSSRGCVIWLVGDTISANLLHDRYRTEYEMDNDEAGAERIKEKWSLRWDKTYLKPILPRNISVTRTKPFVRQCTLYFLFLTTKLSLYIKQFFKTLKRHCSIEAPRVSHSHFKDEMVVVYPEQQRLLSQ